MFHACLAKQLASPLVSEAAHRAIAEAVFSYVSMVTVTAMVQGCKMVTEEHVKSVEVLLLAKRAKISKSRSSTVQHGGNTPSANVMAGAYAAGNGSGVQNAIDFSGGIARPANPIAEGAWLAQGGAAMVCAASIHSAVKKEVELILKDQCMRKKAGVVDVIVKKIECRVSEFLHPLVSSTKVLRANDIKQSAKTAFRGLRIILA